MDKKTANITIAIVGVGLAALVLFQSLFRSVGEEKVHYDPQGIVEAQGNVEQTALNYNALGFRVISSNPDLCVSPNMLASSIGIYGEGAVEAGREQADMMLGASEHLKENHAALSKAVADEKTSSFSCLILDDNIKPKAEFVEANKYYGTYFETIDFHDFVAVKDKINTVASSKTNGQIGSIIDTIYAKSSMVFVSAYKMNGQFSNEVGKITSNTKSFMGNNTEYYDIDKARVKLYEDDKSLFISIPMNDGYEYEVVMSKAGELNGVTLAEIKGYRENAKEMVVSISMPAPKANVKNELKDSLKAVGFDAPFNSTTMLSNLTKHNNVKVDKMDQAIDYSIVGSDDSVVKENAVKSVTIDKPYYYMVSHKGSGLKVIMGKKSA